MMSDPVSVDASTIQELLQTVKTLQSDMAELKSGGNGANNPPTQTEPNGLATLPQSGSEVRGQSPPRKRSRDEDDADSNDDQSSDEDDHVFSLSEVGNAFMETAFKSKMNATSRRKKMAKLGIPDCKWSKAPELDAFIASTIPKDVVKADNVSHKAQRLWLEAAAPLAAIVDKIDAGELEEVDVIQGIKSALLLLGNASQQHSLQRRKTILQHLNPQLKSLVQDADFTEAPPYLFGANFGELAKERLEAAALIQKTQAKPTQNFQKRHPQRYNAWGRRGGSRGNTGPSRGRNFQVGGSRAGTSSKR